MNASSHLSSARMSRSVVTMSVADMPMSPAGAFGVSALWPLAFHPCPTLPPCMCSCGTLPTAQTPTSVSSDMLRCTFPPDDVLEISVCMCAMHASELRVNTLSMYGGITTVPPIGVLPSLYAPSELWSG